MLRDALETIVTGAEAGGGQVIVDADDVGLVNWYNRHGFQSTGADNLRLYLKLATARRYLEKECAHASRRTPVSANASEDE